MNVTYKFTGQKVVVTTPRSFDEVITSLDAAIQRVPMNRRNASHMDSGEGQSTGFILLDDLAWGFEQEWNSKSPARRRVSYQLGTRNMAEALWNAGSAVSRVMPLRVMVVEGSVGHSSEIHYDLMSALAAGKSNREQAKEAINLDKRMAALMEGIVGVSRIRRSTL